MAIQRREKAIRKLVLSFANYYELTIPVEHLYGCEFYGVTETWKNGGGDGAILSKRYSCDSCCISILHGMETKNPWYKNYMHESMPKVNLLERLKADDLENVEIYYEDGTTDNITVPFSDECAKDPFAPNAWQLVSYNPREEFISIHVKRDFKGDDRFWWEKPSNNNNVKKEHSSHGVKYGLGRGLWKKTPNNNNAKEEKNPANRKKG